LKNILIAIPLLISSYLSAEINTLSNDKNITLYNLAMIDAANNNYREALDELKQIKSNNKSLKIKKQYNINIITYFKYKRENLFYESQLELLNELYTNKVNNEEILIIYIKALIDIKKIDKELDISKYMTLFSDYNITSAKNETKILYSALLVYNNQYKEAIKYYKRTLNYNEFYLSILYILNNENYKAINIIENIDKNDMNDYIKLFLYINTGNSENAIKILNQSNIKGILNYKKIFKIKLKEKQELYNYKYKKTKLMEYGDKTNTLFLDLLFAHSEFIYPTDDNYIKSKDVIGGISKQDINKKYQKLKNINLNKKEEFKNLGVYEKLEFYKKSIKGQKNINAYDLYNIGLLYAQSLNYEKAHSFFYKSFYKNPKLSLSGVYMVLLEKYKLKLRKINTKTLENVLNKNTISKYAPISKVLYEYFYKKAPYIKVEEIKEISKLNDFSKAYITFLQTGDISRLKTSSILNKTDEIIYLLYKNIHSTRYAFTSYIQDNIKIYQNLLEKEPIIIGQLYIEMLMSINKANKLNKINFLTNKTATYLRHYAFLETYKKNYENADSIFNMLSNSYDVEDLSYFFNNLITKINLNKEEEIKLLITKGATVFKTDEINLFRSILYFNYEKLDIFKQLLDKNIKSNIIEINISNLDKIIKGEL
jgi:hypothetical protein